MRAFVITVLLFIAGCSNHFGDPVQLRPLQLRPTVHGVVYDVATQQPIAGVRIEIMGRVTTTAANGSYSVSDVPDVPTGPQALTASKDGYATYVTDVQVFTKVTEKKFYLQSM